MDQIRETLTESQLQRQLDRLQAKVPANVVAQADIDAVVASQHACSPHSWFTGWMERAAIARDQARDCLRLGQSASAGRLYLRASEYFRAAGAIYWPNRGDAAIADALRLHVECFRAALDVAGPTYQPIAWEAGVATIGGYLLEPRHASVPARLAVCCGPLDGTAEEQYALAAVEALERGWVVALLVPTQLVECLDTPHGARELREALVDLAETFSTEPIETTAAIGIGDGMGVAEALEANDPEFDLWRDAGERRALGGDMVQVALPPMDMEIEGRRDG